MYLYVDVVAMKSPTSKLPNTHIDSNTPHDTAYRYTYNMCLYVDVVAMKSPTLKLPKTHIDSNTPHDTL